MVNGVRVMVYITARSVACHRFEAVLVYAARYASVLFFNLGGISRLCFFRLAPSPAARGSHSRWCSRARFFF